MNYKKILASVAALFLTGSTFAQTAKYMDIELNNGVHKRIDIEELDSMKYAFNGWKIQQQTYLATGEILKHDLLDIKQVKRRETTLDPIVIKGKVRDTQGSLLAGATIEYDGIQTTSAADGSYEFTIIRSPYKREIIEITPALTTYSKGTVILEGELGDTAYVNPVLGMHTSRTVPVSTGGKVWLSSGSHVVIPANSVKLMNGQAYTGTNVTINAQLINENQEHGQQALLPGQTLSAIDAAGDRQELYSFGMINVELYGDNQEPLQLKAGVLAELRFSVPDHQIADAPKSIPLWYFDEVSGYWKEEGIAILDGKHYIGNVSHFTTWNCDRPHPPCTVTGCLQDNQGAPMIFQDIKVGQSIVQTDSNGCFSVNIPAQFFPLLIGTIDFAQNRFCAIDTIVPINPQSTYNIGTLTSTGLCMNMTLRVDSVVYAPIGNTAPVKISVKIRLGNSGWLIGETINARVISGGGSLNQSSSVTTRWAGNADFNWTPGRNGLQQVEVSYNNLIDTVEYRTVAAALTTTQELYRITGTTSAVYINARLALPAPAPPSQYGVSGETVSARIIAGGGTLNYSQRTTSSGGYVYFTWTPTASAQQEVELTWGTLKDTIRLIDQDPELYVSNQRYAPVNSTIRVVAGVRIIKPYKYGVQGEEVTARVLSGGGSLNIALDSSDHSGEVAFEWTTTANGLQQIELTHRNLKDTITCSPTITSGSMTDARDNEQYGTVSLGGMTWMAENLRYDIPNAQGSLDTAIATYPSTTYGRLYNRSIVLQGAAYSSATPSGVQGICPNGWHLPSRAEWEQLMGYMGNYLIASDSFGSNSLVQSSYNVKSTTGWNTNNGSNGRDLIGFNALPAGSLDGSMNFTGLGESTSFASTSAEVNTWGTQTYSANIDNYSTTFSILGNRNPSLVSCRCVKD